MPNPQAATKVLDTEFLTIRAKILELAASFDRLERGEGSVDGDPRMQQIHEALAVLTGEESEKAERTQMTFSRSYRDDWRNEFGI